jgi:hypothetical protein
MTGCTERHPPGPDGKAAGEGRKGMTEVAP